MKTQKAFEIIATIRGYDNSVAMPDKEFFDAEGAKNLLLGSGSHVGFFAEDNAENHD